MTFEKFFRKASRTPKHADGFPPYPYQMRLANHDSLPEVLSVPTGVGKTAAAILSWLYRRRNASSQIRQSTPRRLVYCLPMRTLVEQTRDAAKQWITNLGFHEGTNPVKVHILMGGADSEDWNEHPERDAILIGTQDMLLSRALNRGYGMSRYQWPMHFALLNNDCRWVLDETQLMGVGVTTSAQLQGFREKLNVFGIAQTVWMSATLDAKVLATVDHPCPDDGWRTESLDDKDFASARIQQLIDAKKPCRRAETVLTKDNQSGYAPSIAEEVLHAHKPNQLTLVVVNRVDRAQNLFTAITKLSKKQEQPPETCLIHSRFRPHERGPTQQQALSEDDLPGGGRIIVATQAIEAGVDLSATTLFTELAPWSSLVQRFGRCNRRGTCGKTGSPKSDVVWIDIDTHENTDKNLPLPYSVEELDQARSHIIEMTDVGPQTLGKVEHAEPPGIVHTIRRKDLIDLFDTTPDLAGNDLDVSRYIRDSDDNDVQVYWRDWDEKENKGAPPSTKDDDGTVQFFKPLRDELCSVSIAQFKKFLGNKKVGRCWNPLDREWRKVSGNDVRPGMLLVLQCDGGGYDAELGWTGNVKNKPELVPLDVFESEDSMESEYSGKNKLTFSEHTQDVVDALQGLRHPPHDQPTLTDLLDDPTWDDLSRAAWWHDIGKLHPAFQGAIHHARDDLDKDEWWAKSGTEGWLKYQMPDGTKRPGFRHELASTLAWLNHHDGERHADLIAYLIASHHGKVRLSIRSMPNEQRPKDLTTKFARGVWDNDPFPAVTLGNGDTCEAFNIDLSLMELGESPEGKPSWLARTIGLRDEHGPFKLAFLETLLMLADWRGSAKGDDRK